MNGVGPNSGTTAPQGRAANALRLDRRSIHFSVNAWVKENSFTFDKYLIVQICICWIY